MMMNEMMRAKSVVRCIANSAKSKNNFQSLLSGFQFPPLLDAGRASGIAGRPHIFVRAHSKAATMTAATRRLTAFLAFLVVITLSFNVPLNFTALTDDTDDEYAYPNSMKSNRYDPNEDNENEKE